MKTDKSRRKFLRVLPLGIFAGMAGVLAAAAFRFLRPVAAAQREAVWLDVAPVSELKGEKPLLRTVLAERSAGWSVTLEEQQVFILPAQKHQALSSMCPHEGCNVVWRDETNNFFCPCHDSAFAPDGERVSGPARRGLDPLPSREKDGILQVQYQTFVNNIKERIPRA
ncbi:MAG: Rieske (2Fe-2S) protein [Acidobacteria bacterium]|nr:Rieske (2Fe-2S) protein [Acidobacteriota bacterium]